jgi:hypothetical protein
VKTYRQVESPLWAPDPREGSGKTLHAHSVPLFLALACPPVVKGLWTFFPSLLSFHLKGEARAERLIRETVEGELWLPPLTKSFSP